MKILLTGGSGYLGRNFIEKYGKKYDIVAPTSSEADLTKISDLNKIFRANKFDAVIHFAGKADGNSGALVEADNLIMFKNVQYLTILNGVKKLILAGDSAEFDRSKPLVDILESEFGQSIPSDAYGLGRYLMQVLAAKDKITATLRFFSVYGGDLSPDNSKISEIIARGITGKKVIELEGDRILSAVYIDDALKVIAAFVDNDFPAEDYNVVADSKTSYVEIAKIVKRLAKKNNREVEIKCLYKQLNENSGLNYKLSIILPKLKFTTVNTGVSKTFEYLSTHKSVLRKKKEEN